MKLFCYHIYGKVDKNGYQYCEKCGKSVCVGIPDPQKCGHEWLVINTLSQSNAFTRNSCFSSLLYIQECKHCGELRKFSTDNFSNTTY